MIFVIWLIAFILLLAFMAAGKTEDGIMINTTHLKSIGMRLRSRVKGKIQSRVYSFTPEGMEKLKLLREEYPDNRKSTQYIKAYQKIHSKIRELKALPLDTLNRIRDIKVQRETLKTLNTLFPVRKHIPEYIEKYNIIREENVFQKKRVTYNFGLYWSIFLCILRREWSVIKELYTYEMSYSHNIVTDEGDALIADHMSETDARTLIDNTNGHIAVGTGWTGTTPKSNLATNTPTGSPEVMDATYPKLKGTWGNTDDNVVQYRATFEAGDLNITGIDEAGLGNNAVEATGDNLAYGQITPTVDVTTSDTLQVDWEHTYVGA